MSSAEKITLVAQVREAKKKAVADLRKSGFVPGVIYGHGVENQLLQIPLVDLEKAYKATGESTLLNLQIGDGALVPVLIHAITLDVITNKISHVDFYVVNMKEEVTTEVPLHFVGIAPAVKALGGVLVKTKDHITIKCLPADLISEFEIDITVLENFENSILISDLKLPAGIAVQDTADDLVATVAAPRTDAEMDALNAEVNADVSKVEGAEEKKPEDAAAADKAGDKKSDK